MGGCLGATAKLGPCASSKTCASVSGVLERFLTHFWMSSLVVAISVVVNDVVVAVVGIADVILVASVDVVDVVSVVKAGTTVVL